jgi:hypothetical protein
MKQTSRSRYSLMARLCNNMYNIQSSLNAYFFIDGILFSLNNPVQWIRLWVRLYNFSRCVSMCFGVKLNIANI